MTPQPKGLHCVSRDKNCPEWCIFEHEKIWCACFEAKNIHNWWELQKIVNDSRRSEQEIREKVLDELGALYVKVIETFPHHFSGMLDFREWVLNQIDMRMKELRSKQGE